MENSDSVRRMLIVTDGVFSMDGDIALLPEIVEVADEYGAVVMVDDAHGEGVLGDSGRGIVNHFNLEGRVEIEVGTLSKALGVMGGYITGPGVLIDYLRQKGRPFLFSTGLTRRYRCCNCSCGLCLHEAMNLSGNYGGNAVYYQGRLTEAGV